MTGVNLLTDPGLDVKRGPSKYENVVLTTFNCVNWLAVLAIFMFSIFTYVRTVDTNMFDMTLYCEDERFNKTATPINMIFPIIVLILLFVACTICLVGRMLISNKLFDKDLKNAVHFALGLILTWDVCAALQNMISYPSPYFYQDEDIRNHFCCESCAMNMTRSMKILDETLRESFPSIFMSISWYVIVYVSIFVYLMDCIKSFAIKIVTLLIPSLITLHYMILLWKNNQNHAEDLYVGSVIGLTMALFVMNDFHTLIKPQEWMLADNEDEEDSFVEENITPRSTFVPAPSHRHVVPMAMIYPALDFPMREIISLGAMRVAPDITEVKE